MKDGERHNISRHPEHDDSPVWSSDGKRLAFRTERHWETDIYYLFLTDEDDKKSMEERKKEEEEKEKEEGEEKEDPVVRIDFEDIYRRARKVTSTKGEEHAFALSPDGKTYAFCSDSLGESYLWTAAWDGSELKQLTKLGSPPKTITWSKDSGKIFYLASGGTIHSIAKDGGGHQGIHFSAEMEIDRAAERRQAFDEAWRGIKNYFYDPEFHGVDWVKVREEYEWRLPYAQTTEDLHTIIEEMIGELSASYLGIGKDRGGGCNGCTT